MGGDERLQLGHRPAVRPALEPCVDEVLGRRQPQFLQAKGLAAHPRELGELTEGVAAPQLERAFECRDPVIAGGGTDEILEPRRVELEEIDVDGVPRPAGADERIGGEGAAQAGDVALQGGPGRLRRCVLPQRLTEAIEADGSAAGGDEHGQELPALQPVDREDGTSATHLEWTEHVHHDA